MKYLMLHLAITALTVNFLFSQKVNINSEYMRYYTYNLPKKPVLDQNLRTYNVIPYNENQFGYEAIKNTVNLNQFKQVENNPYLLFKISDVTVGISTSSIDKKTKKTKNSNGIEITSEVYSYSMNYNGGFSVELKIKNEEPVIKRFNLNEFHEDKKEFATKDEATKYFNEIKDEKLKQLRDYVLNRVIVNFSSFIKENFSFGMSEKSLKFYFIDNEDFPEYKNVLKNKLLLKKIFAKMKPSENVTWFSEDVKNYVDFNKSLIENNKNNQEDKNAKKIIGTSYINITNLYFAIEDFDNAIKFATLAKENGYNEAEGQQIIDAIESLKKILLTNKLSKTRDFQESQN